MNGNHPRADSAPNAEPSRAAAEPTLAEATRVWLKIGLLGFGGPAGQIALMHRIVVDERRWIDEARFLHALNYCMLLPGPEAQQLAIYLGWLLHRTTGGLIAGILFVLPGAAIMLGLSVVFVRFQQVPLFDGVFYGIKAAVLAIVIEAVLRIGRRSLHHRPLKVMAALAFFAMFFLNAPFPLVVLAAGMIGLAWPSLAATKTVEHGAVPVGAAARSAASLTAPTRSRQAATLIIGLVIWLLPTLGCAALLGWTNTLTQIGLFFSKMAVVTFGGAYAVLSYVAQQAVEVHGWLDPDEMLTGLGLAETTPGPLILVLLFVAFLGGYRDPGSLSPMAGGLAGGLMATWVTFVPCFIWIFLGAPHVERLRHNVRLSAALAAISAAVVGVILNLALWFALHVVFAAVTTEQAGPLRLFVPDLKSVDWVALALAGGAMIAMLKFKVGILPVVGVSAAIGAGIRMAA